MTRLEIIQSAILAALGHVKPDYRSPRQLDETARQIAVFVDGALDEHKPAWIKQYEEKLFSDGGPGEEDAPLHS
jgi:hypothetical protein